MFKAVRRLSILKHSLRRYQVTCHPIEPCDPRTDVTILGNGIRIATEHQPSAVSCMGLFIEAGSRYETMYNNGITHFLEHLAYKGFVGMSRCELELYLLYMGAKMTAKTGREIQSFTGVFPSECYPQMFEILAGVATNLLLDPCEIEMEKFNMCLEMVDEDNDPQSVIFDYLHQSAFQGTPLGQPVIGPSKNVRRFDKDFAVNFLCQHYQPYKLCIATSGKVRHDDVVRLAEEKLGHLYGDATYESDEGPTRFTGSQIIYRDDSMPFAHVAIAFEAPGYGSSDYITLYVASHIMGQWHKSQGGGRGNASYIARGSSLNDSCERFKSFYIAYRDVGLWGVYFVAKRWDIEDMVEQIQQRWMHLCMTTHPTEVERAINSAKMKMAQHVCGVIKSCNDIGTQLMYTCTRKSLEEKFHLLSCVKYIEVRECTERMMYDRCPVVAAVGPTECLPDYCRIRANQYWLRV